MIYVKLSVSVKTVIECEMNSQQLIDVILYPGPAKFVAFLHGIIRRSKGW